MEINYKTDVLELANGIPAQFIRENPLPTRFKYTVALDPPGLGGSDVWQFDYQGKARDGKYPDLQAARKYTIWEIWTFGKLKPGLVSRDKPTRDLAPYEYLVEKAVDLVAKTVVVTTRVG